VIFNVSFKTPQNKASYRLGEQKKSGSHFLPKKGVLQDYGPEIFAAYGMDFQMDVYDNHLIYHSRCFLLLCLSRAHAHDDDEFIQTGVNRRNRCSNKHRLEKPFLCSISKYFIAGFSLLGIIRFLICSKRDEKVHRNSRTRRTTQIVGKQTDKMHKNELHHLLNYKSLLIKYLSEVYLCSAVLCGMWSKKKL